MKKLTVLALLFVTLGVFAQQKPLTQGQPGPNIPKGKAPEQGYVPEGWPAHPGSLLKYSVEIRFGEEPESMPEGMKFGRVSAVTTILSPAASLVFGAVNLTSTQLPPRHSARAARSLPATSSKTD